MSGLNFEMIPEQINGVTVLGVAKRFHECGYPQHSQVGFNVGLTIDGEDAPLRFARAIDAVFDLGTQAVTFVGEVLVEIRKELTRTNRFTQGTPLLMSVGYLVYHVYWYLPVGKAVLFWDGGKLRLSNLEREEVVPLLSELGWTQPSIVQPALAAVA